MKRHVFSIVAVLLLALIALPSATPAFAAQDATIQSITLNGCFIDVTFQVQDAGDYFVNFWDDGNFRGGAGGAVPANGTVTVRYLIGDPILEGAAGIGIYVQEALGPGASAFYDTNGNYAVPAAVGDPCAAANTTSVSVLSAGTAGCDMMIAIPADAVVGAFVADADTYWTPGSLTNPLITLPAGKTAWVFGVDESAQYHRIL